MGQQYLIDSNIVIDYLSGKMPDISTKFLNQVIDEIPMVSIITKIEVLGFKATQEIDDFLSSFFEDSIILGLTDEVADKTIQIRKEMKIKTPDAIIAATAITQGLVLLTRNENDFLGISDLQIVNPYKL